jgi:hypothetical protein
MTAPETTDWKLDRAQVATVREQLFVLAEVLGASRTKANFKSLVATAAVLKRHFGREPDTFRLTDASGRIIGVFPIRRGS